MITVLTGENSYALHRALAALVNAFVDQYGDLALERIDGQDAEYDKIAEAVHGLPFLASKKLVVITSGSGNKQYLDEFEQLFNDMPETNDIIIVESKVDKRTAYFKFLKKCKNFTDFPAMSADALYVWAPKYVKEQQGTISNGDARYLVDRVGLNQQLVSSELDKLLLFDATISRETIDLLTEPNPQSTVFQLLEAAFAGNPKQALKLYEEQRAMKVEPQQIIAMLAWQLHVIALLKTAGDRSTDQIAQEGKINPYVLRKSSGIARKISANDFKSMLNDLQRIDVRTKTSNIDVDEALQNYLLRLSS